MRLLPLAAVFAVALVVCADAQAASTPTAVQRLAARYAPVVQLSEQEEPCGSGESFEPIDVNALFGRADVTLLGPPRSNLVKRRPRASDLAGGHSGDALDFPGDPLKSSGCSYERFQRRIAAGHRPTVYAHVATEDGELALQYWFFYVFNDFNNKHEGDWELIQLDFNTASPAVALRRHPFEVGYSQHEGAERADWGASKLELERGTHPIVYPAEGSHANYFSGALYLGRSAAEGVGCDDTNAPWRRLVPAVAVFPQAPRAARAGFPWLSYEGHWGERRRGFYNAPTGPNTKAQWTEPITWANESWRSKSFALAGGRSLGPTATQFFCRAISAGSTALILVATHPGASAAIVVTLLILLAWLATRTRWRPPRPEELRSPRPWGTLVTAAARTYRTRARLFVPIGAIFLVVGVAVVALQYLVFRHTGVSSLVDSFGASNGLTETVVLGFGSIGGLIGLAVVQAVCATAMVRLSEGRPVSAGQAYRAVVKRWRPLLGGLAIATVVVVIADLTLIGLPIAIYLTIRWSLLAQAVALEDESATGALRRSARLVRGAWWRTASLTVFVTGIALLLGPLVGTLLLFATSASFDVVNFASDLVYVVALPFAAVATTYLYFDLTARSAAGAH
ncbi:MAG TPA: hypothetical protein VKB43_05020, partial [Gaiellaceae bacterium]|nr:hypothetical protein [Gaiellaceae bacterium]